jgi:hypothetical protein
MGPNRHILPDRYQCGREKMLQSPVNDDHFIGAGGRTKSIRRPLNVENYSFAERNGIFTLLWVNTFLRQ